MAGRQLFFPGFQLGQRGLANAYGFRIRWPGWQDQPEFDFGDDLLEATELNVNFDANLFAMHYNFVLNAVMDAAVGWQRIGIGLFRRFVPTNNPVAYFWIDPETSNPRNVLNACQAILATLRGMRGPYGQNQFVLFAK